MNKAKKSGLFTNKIKINYDNTRSRKSCDGKWAGDVGILYSYEPKEVKTLIGSSFAIH